MNIHQRCADHKPAQKQLDGLLEMFNAIQTLIATHDLRVHCSRRADNPLLRGKTVCTCQQCKVLRPIFISVAKKLGK